MIVQRIWWCSDGESAGVGVDYICAAIDITDGNEPRQRRRDIVASPVSCRNHVRHGDVQQPRCGGQVEVERFGHRIARHHHDD